LRKNAVSTLVVIQNLQGTGMIILIISKTVIFIMDIEKINMLVTTIALD